jgi:hypothetical protein
VRVATSHPEEPAQPAVAKPHPEEPPKAASQGWRLAHSVAFPSLPDSTRQSMQHFHLLRVSMDARVKPGHDHEVGAASASSKDGGRLGLMVRDGACAPDAMGFAALNPSYSPVTFGIA